MNELRRAILDDGRPQYILARLIETTETRLSRIVCGRAAPTLDEQRRLAEVLGVEAAKLFGVATPPSPFASAEKTDCNRPCQRRK